MNSMRNVELPRNVLPRITHRDDAKILVIDLVNIKTNESFCKEFYGKVITREELDVVFEQYTDVLRAWNVI